MFVSRCGKRKEPPGDTGNDPKRAKADSSSSDSSSRYVKQP